MIRNEQIKVFIFPLLMITASSFIFVTEFYVVSCSTASQSLNMIEMVSNRDPDSSSSLSLLLM